MIHSIQSIVDEMITDEESIADHENVPDVELVRVITEFLDAKGALDISTMHYLACLNELAEQRYFRTEDGRVGVGPMDVQVGDDICIFDGAAIPHILRSRGTQGTFTLVGEAYVHGIMYGEADPLGLPSHDLVLV
jgi:hypothetical protein